MSDSQLAFHYAQRVLDISKVNGNESCNDEATEVIIKAKLMTINPFNGMVVPLKVENKQIEDKQKNG